MTTMEQKTTRTTNKGKEVDLMTETIHQTFERHICSKCLQREACKEQFGENNVETMLEPVVKDPKDLGPAEHRMTHLVCPVYNIKDAGGRPEDYKIHNDTTFYPNGLK